MTVKQILKQLKDAGTAQNRKIYKRHGASEPLYGVSFKVLNNLKKKLKINHDIALELWQNNYYEAKLLALMIADPSQLTMLEAEAWLKQINSYSLSNYLGSLVAQTVFADKAFKKWSKSKQEYFKHCAYDVLATLLKNGDILPKEEAMLILDKIEKEIHKSPNRARNAMNTAMIAIGVYCKGMKTHTIKTAKRIGKVQVDHGETNCKTPDAVEYIHKTFKYRNSKR